MLITVSYIIELTVALSPYAMKLTSNIRKSEQFNCKALTRTIPVLERAPQHFAESYSQPNAPFVELQFALRSISIQIWQTQGEVLRTLVHHRNNVSQVLSRLGLFGVLACALITGRERESLILEYFQSGVFPFGQGKIPGLFQVFSRSVHRLNKLIELFCVF